MPNIASAKKKLRGDVRKALINKRIRNKAKIALKTTVASPSQENLSKAYSALDIAVKKNILTKQKVARSKSQVAKLVVGKASAQTKPKSKPKGKKKTA